MECVTIPLKPVARHDGRDQSRAVAVFSDAGPVTARITEWGGNTLRWSARACAPKWSLSRIISSGKIESEGKAEAPSMPNLLPVLSLIRYSNERRISVKHEG